MLFTNIYAQDLSFVADVARTINIRQSLVGAGVDLSIAAAAAKAGSGAAGGNLNLAGGAGDGAGAPGNVLASAAGTIATRGLMSLRNPTAATTGQQQWAPGYESIGHGWTYQTFPGASLSRSGSSTVTVTTASPHGLANGASVYVTGGTGSGSATFAVGAFVIGGVTSLTFTYTDASNAGTGTLTQAVYDSTGADNAVKVDLQMRPVIGRRYQDITSDHGMASPEMVFFRSAYPNNGAYAEWFKFSATVNSTGYPLVTTGGVTMQTVKADGVTPGSYLALAPATVVLQDDNGVGFQTFPASSFGNFNAIGVANWNAALMPSIDSKIGLSLGLPSHSWFDVFDVKSSGQFLGLGDPACPGWYNAQGVYGQLGGAGWDNSTLLPNSLAALLVFGGQSCFKALANMGALTVTPTGGATGNYTYFVVASDRNGFTTLAGTGSTTTGPAALDATHYNTVTWTAIAGAVQYDVYLLSIGQAGYIGTSLTASFKDTGATRYVSGVNGASGSGTLVDVPKNPTSSGGSGGGSSTYYIYAMDFDGHLTAVSASTTIAQTPSVASPISLAWSPIGGAFAYLICRGANTKPIGLAYVTGGNVPQITQGTGGGNLSKSGSTTVTATMSSGSQSGGHGFRVGDTFTVVHTGTADANFIGGTFTVATVPAYNQFTYVETGGTSVTATAAGGVIMTYTGASLVVSPAFSDAGFAPRVIGSATRNSTADISCEGFINYTGVAAAVPPSPGWIAPTLSGTWVNFGGAFAVAGYRKDANGIVWIKGFVKAGVASSLIFTLPAGYRPAESRVFPSMCYNNVTVSACQLIIDNAGGVTQGTGNPTGTTQQALECCFYAEG